MRKQKLTQKEAARLIRDCGRTLVVRDGEFIVKIHGNPIDHPTTNFTNDLEDAVHTAKSEWGRERAEKETKEYIARLAEKVEVVTLTAPALADDSAVRIEYWWDRISRNWIIQAKDSNDNQIGAAEYAANTRTLPGALEAMREQYPGVTCVKS